MADEVVHLFSGRPEDGAVVLINSQITLCCKAWMGDTRIKVGTTDPDAATCTGTLSVSA